MPDKTALPDPPVRADRLCALPGCRKPLVEITPRHRRYAGDALLMDPFCSSTCCRTYHQNPLPTRSIWENDYGMAAA